MFFNPVKEFVPLLSEAFWIDAISTLRANSPKIIVNATLINAPEFIQQLKKATSAYIFYMPSPPEPMPSPTLVINTGIKIGGKKLQLYFRTPNNRGRLLGFGSIPHEGKPGNNKQLFRMDYHSDHGQKTWQYYWKDGDFHFHVGTEPKP